MKSEKESPKARMGFKPTVTPDEIRGQNTLLKKPLMKTTFLTSTLLLLTLTSCTQTLTPQAWLSQNTAELKQGETYDFSALKESIGDKRIVALGESSHGIGDYYHFKSALIKYLHEEMGFEVLAMEGGLGDINLAWLNIDTLSPAALRQNTVFGNFQAEEVNPLFEHIVASSKTKHPLIYTGFDTQASTQYFKQTLQAILSDYDRDFADELLAKFNAYYSSYQAGMKEDSLAYLQHRDIFSHTAQQATKLLIANKASIQRKHQLSPFAFDIFLKTLEGFSASVNLSYDERYLGVPLRDELMAQNIEWLLDTIYPDKKFIIWAHNAHIDRTGVVGSPIKWMGHYVAEKYQDDYYALGLFAYQGETYQHWTRETISFENKASTFVEKRMLSAGKHIAFLDILHQQESMENAWLFQAVDAFELENGGQVSFVPTKRFDGLVSFTLVKAPTY